MRAIDESRSGLPVGLAQGLEVRGRGLHSRRRPSPASIRCARRPASNCCRIPNAAAGALRQPTPVRPGDVDAVFAYQVVPLDGSWPVCAHHTALSALAAWGFPVAPEWQVCDSLATCSAMHAGGADPHPPLRRRRRGGQGRRVSDSRGKRLGVIGGRVPRGRLRESSAEAAFTGLAIEVNTDGPGALAPTAIWSRECRGSDCLPCHAPQRRDHRPARCPHWRHCRGHSLRRSVPKVRVRTEQAHRCGDHWGGPAECRSAKPRS